MANVFRADHIGSLVKPQSLLTAQAAFAAGSKDQDEAALRKVEEEAIKQALDLQKKVVMTVVTDGEMRRTNADDPYVRSLEGIKRHAAATGVASVLQSAYGVCEPVSQRQRFTEDEVRFLKSTTAVAFKICLLSPSTLAMRFYKPGMTDTAYRSVQELAGAFSLIVQREIEALTSDGVAYVQINSPAYDALYDGSGLHLHDLPGLASAGAFDELVAIDAAMLRKVKVSASTLAMHLGRAEGVNHTNDRYERMIEKLLGTLPVDRVLLEYGESAAHDFRALKALPAGMMAVLGLVRTDGEPEEIGDVIRRVELAARQAPEENLALSPRKGFANIAGHAVDADLAAQKRCLIRASEVVQQFWGLEL